jgi:hypothetical protein
MTNTRYEKCETVLWALTPPDGILLHNFSQRLYIDLTGLEKVVWDHLDGLHTVQSIIDLAESRARFYGLKRPKARSVATQVITRLLEGGFVISRTVE